MAQRPKAKQKRNGQKNTDKKQFERFKEAARTLGVDESGDTFERVFEKIVPPKRQTKSG